MLNPTPTAMVCVSGKHGRLFSAAAPLSSQFFPAVALANEKAVQRAMREKAMADAARATPWVKAVWPRESEGARKQQEASGQELRLAGAARAIRRAGAVKVRWSGLDDRSVDRVDALAVWRWCSARYCSRSSCQIVAVTGDWSAAGRGDCGPRLLARAPAANGWRGVPLPNHAMRECARATKLLRAEATA